MFPKFYDYGTFTLNVAQQKQIFKAKRQRGPTVQIDCVTLCSPRQSTPPIVQCCHLVTLCDTACMRIGNLIGAYFFTRRKLVQTQIGQGVADVPVSQIIRLSAFRIHTHCHRAFIEEQAPPSFKTRLRSSTCLGTTTTTPNQRKRRADQKKKKKIFLPE